MPSNPNDDLAAAMDEAGISNKALAREVRRLGAERGLAVSCTHVDVARWLSGMRPRGAKPELIASVLAQRLGRPLTLPEIGMDSRKGPPLTLGLAFSGQQAATVRTSRILWDEDLRQEDFLWHGTVSAAMLVPPMARWLVAPPHEPLSRTGRTLKVSRHDVDAVRATARMFEELDHRYGGGHARRAAVQYLRSEVAPLLHGNYTDQIRRELFAETARFTYKTGAMAYDIGLHGLARRYFVQALSLAHASGDRALGGKVLAVMSHQANFLGEYGEAVDFARAAKLGAKGQATATVHAMYCVMEARGLASLGDRRACLRALREAEGAFAKAGTMEEPEWIGYFDEAEFHDEFGHCFAALRQSDDATRHARMALESSSDAYPRSRTFCRMTMAGAYLAPQRPSQRDVEQACAVASQALALVDRLKSHRVREYVRTFDRSLDSYAALAPVVAFRQQLREMALCAG
ncbi:transcriptional regulator [Spongiactinospora gelatinilytica]|uniref:Transcriptional regulator n=1 Tax=Spongiactinospora gelatinilytica TaxID=2666298 RepID=A0A2W2GR40_9ACTN|nr:transcriptional regulator [Spongiactinospora gelatinilytica]PZG45039.1 transcriptional regulator [Spongiactinospora gelatinilytica]